ncbi:uncharacterized protein LOC144654107 [Oculina patagonica]
MLTLHPFSVEKGITSPLPQEERRTAASLLQVKNVEFKVFLLCFAVLVAATSVCKCEDKKETASKYKVKIKDGDKEVDEEIEVDTEKQTETLHVPKTDSGNAGEVDVVYDFKKNLTMHRLSAAKACFLSESTEDMPKPDDLIKLLDQQSNAPARNGTNSVYDAVSELTDRSDLSDEMASLCAKLPIYRVKKAMFISQRVKRFTFDFTYLCCDTYCYKYRSWCYNAWGYCYPCYKRKCYRRCDWYWCKMHPI